MTGGWWARWPRRRPDAKEIFEACSSSPPTASTVATRRPMAAHLPDRLLKANYPFEVPRRLDDARYGNTDKLAEFRSEAGRPRNPVSPPSISRVGGSVLTSYAERRKSTGNNAIHST